MATPPAIDVRAALAAAPLRPLERLTDVDRPDTALRVLEEGWRWKPSFPAIAIEAPMAWEDTAAAHRSWLFHLHAWDPLGPLLALHDETGDERALRRASAVAVDWAEAYPTLETPSPFAWYDMAVGLRAFRLGYLLDAVARHAWAPDRDFDVLLACARTHLAALADDAGFAAHSNHGLYQAVGQLSLARRLADLPETSDARRLGEDRLRRLVEAQFDADGAHREHSPGYHLMVLETLAEAVRADLVPDDAVRQRSRAATDALAWFVLPDRTLAMFGDTTAQRLTGRAVPLATPALLHAVTGGLEGTPPAQVERTFRDAGYVVFRDRWPAPPDDARTCSYLAQTAGFHSRQHKHADHLSIVWHDRGRQLLVDAGLFGYLDPVEPGSTLFDEGYAYADPPRVHVESTRAHNTVEIDGRSHRRRRVPFFGSAVRETGTSAGDVRFAVCALTLEDVEWERVLLFLPGRWLIVLDALRGTAPHDFAQWFHLHPELEARAGRSGRFAAALPGERIALHVAPLLPSAATEVVRGQSEPSLLGVTSPDIGVLEPSSTFAYTASGEGHVFGTLLTLARHAPRTGASTVSADGGDAVLRWVDDRSHVVRLARRAGAVAIDHAERPRLLGRAQARTPRSR